ncbi:MIF-like protein mif-2 [Mya arenaria]|uniref:MIF-like protein mif-2 n=1 Tax=Mya arenaria TaxID=6604 RepID=UPI0022E3C9A4|nr:MIF-like protein mif-2 [Mya arenaria]XP_052794248.1 MIF-like protein mif-2 [Mya arenaria]
MPLCYIYTNLKSEELADTLEEQLTVCVSKTLGKPRERISVLVFPGTRMMFQGSENKGIICQIRSIDVFDESRNPAYFPPIMEVLTTASGLDAKRITIELVDLPAHMVKTGK